MNFLLKPIVIVLMSLLALSSAKAQNDPKAEAILKKLSDKTAKSKGIAAQFTSNLQNLKDGINLDQKGNIQIKAEKYKLEIDKYLVISDGKTLWNYNREDNEVNISDASDMEDELNPAEIFTIYQKGFKSKHEGNITEGGERLDVVNLYPLNPKEKPFHTIVLHINSNTDLKKIVVKYKDGNLVTYKISDLKYEQEFAADNFSFKSAKFPGVEINDLR
ncbi:MAG: LolA family protein [Luteibaculaceae bacterium]